MSPNLPTAADELSAWRQREWLEADGLGGFASGTAAGIRTRRYHALLLSALQPPTGRVVLVNGCEAWIETAAGKFALSSHDYSPDTIHPDGVRYLTAFTADPWPTWTFQLPDGLIVRQELFVPRGKNATILRWTLESGESPVTGPVRLTVRPLISGRDYHSTHHENPSFRFDPVSIEAHVVRWQPYSDLPVIRAVHNGRYTSQPNWFRNFLYREERDRGLDDSEDLASPGVFEWDLQQAPAVWLLTAETPQGLVQSGPADDQMWTLLAQRERTRRGQYRSPADWGAESYLVRRGTGQTIIAGYPWFTDWGRDTFISLRGLCLATDRLEQARQILLAWSQCVSHGMLPNRFPDVGTEPEYNSVDASLWFIVAVYEFLELADSTHLISDADESNLLQAVEEILRGYQRGTRFGIHSDSDGLLAAGETGVALTWMDARVGGEAVTPRCGKPVEIQALWINALRIGEELLDVRIGDWRASQASFLQRFWLSEPGALVDVVDDRHQAGRVDAAVRPNQIFAVGGLPFPILEGERARQVVSTVQSQLWTPAGLRTLSPEHAAYCGQCVGEPEERDRAYHQGTVWPWLMGPFVEAWVRVQGDTEKTRQSARDRFLVPFSDMFSNPVRGPLHLPEIADGDPPHIARGCPLQAWSLGEYLRLDLVVLGNER